MSETSDVTVGALTFDYILGTWAADFGFNCEDSHSKKQSIPRAPPSPDKAQVYKNRSSQRLWCVKIALVLHDIEK